MNAVAMSRRIYDVPNLTAGDSYYYKVSNILPTSNLRNFLRRSYLMNESPHS